VAYLRTLRDDRSRPAPERVTVNLTGGNSLSGAVLGQSLRELQLLTADGKIALLRPDGDNFRQVTSGVDWPTYHGNLSGNRYSELDEVNVDNVSGLAPVWSYHLQGAGRLQMTPIVVDGIMYVTNANEAIALDPGTGRQLWQYSRPRTNGLAGDAASGINRGAAVAGERLFLITDHAHILALKAAGCERIFREKASGGRWDRPQLHKLLDQLRKGDVVVVWKLDRLSRSLRDVLILMERVAEAKAGFRSLTEAIDTTTPAGRMMMHMVGAFAEFERAMLKERTKAGLDAARKEGRVGGRRPKLSPQQQAEIRKMVLKGDTTAADAARLFKIHPATVSRLLAREA